MAVYTLPDYLKDPANYERVRIFVEIAGNREQTMSELGFESETQYKEWNRVHGRLRGREWVAPQS